jgi:hypothetical protein
MKSILIAILLAAAFAAADDKQAVPAAPQIKPAEVVPMVQHISLETENKILRVEHKYDAAELQKQNAQAQFLTLKELYLSADKMSKDAIKELNQIVDQAWKDSKLSKNDYDFDPANFTFVPKKPKAKASSLKEKP